MAPLLHSCPYLHSPQAARVVFLEQNLDHITPCLKPLVISYPSHLEKNSNSIKTLHGLDQGLTNFCEGPHKIYFQIGEPHGVHGNHLTLLGITKAVIGNMYMIGHSIVPIKLYLQTQLEGWISSMGHGLSTPSLGTCHSKRGPGPGRINITWDLLELQTSR